MKTTQHAGNFSGHLHPACAGGPDFQEGKMGLVLMNQFQCFGPVSRFAAYDEIRPDIGKHGLQMADSRVIAVSDDCFDLVIGHLSFCRMREPATKHRTAGKACRLICTYFTGAATGGHQFLE